MQPKTSMVIPCYNKAKWIAGLFDSVIAQKWDNIEVIIVNDGSTDGTCQIIAEYEPRFKTRGYEVVIIDQENQGVASAVKNGLMRITGEFTCQVDADDELDPEYVSAMADWLCEHPSDMAVACDVDVMPWIREEQGCPRQVHNCKAGLHNLVERALLYRMYHAPYFYLVRTSYIYSSKMIERFCTKPRGCQEWQFLVPLLVGGGDIGRLQRILYYHNNHRDNSIMTSLTDYEKTKGYFCEYLEQARITLYNHGYLTDYTQKVLEIGRLGFSFEFLAQYEQFDRRKACYELIDVINNSGFTDFKISYDKVECYGFRTFYRYICNIILNKPRPANQYDRIVAYPAYGRAITKNLNYLLSSDIAPDVFWDIAAKEGDMLGDKPVAKPDFESLTERDLILLVLKNTEVSEGVYKQILRTPAGDNVWFYTDVLDYIHIHS